MSVSYKAFQLRGFKYQLSTDRFGTSFIHKGVTYACIAPPRNVMLEMKPDNYMQQIPASFQMLAEADADFGPGFDTSGITINSNFTAGDFTFEVVSYSLDDQEPSVTLKCRRKQ